MDQEFWLTSLDHHSGIEISIKEETLNLMYKGFLMQEGKIIYIVQTTNIEIHNRAFMCITAILLKATLFTF